MAELNNFLHYHSFQQILWKKVSRSGYQSGFRQKSSLSLRRIVEVRRGQQTPQFDKFPYEEVEDLSFSLLFESESEGTNYTVQ